MNLAKLFADTQLAEGFTPGVKPDSGGTWQTGYGRNLTTDPLTPAEGEYLMQGPMMARIVELTKALPWFAPLDDVRQRALAEMAYQMGTGGLLGFHDLLACASRGDWIGAAHNVQFNSDGSYTALATETPSRAARYAAMLKTGVDQ